MGVRISEVPFDPYDEIRARQRCLGDKLRRVGATATFVGSMRDFSSEDQIEMMSIEHYPGMTDKHLRKIEKDARQRWNLDDVLIIHRVGDLVPADPIVLVAVWANHRAHAFEACRFIMEGLKSSAPFWKKERGGAGERWVSKNTPGFTEEVHN